MCCLIIYPCIGLSFALICLEEAFLTTLGFGGHSLAAKEPSILFLDQKKVCPDELRAFTFKEYVAKYKKDYAA